jgi:phage regulator Rha-like protein
MEQLLSKTTKLSLLDITEHQQVMTVLAAQRGNALVHLTQLLNMQKETTTFAGQLTQSQMHYFEQAGLTLLAQQFTSRENHVLDALN